MGIPAGLILFAWVAFSRGTVPRSRSPQSTVDDEALGSEVQGRRHVQAESEAGRETEMTPLALEGLAVVELDPSGDPQPAPDAHQTAGDLPLTFGSQDLDGCSSAADVDGVESVEGAASLQMPRADQ